MFWLWQWYCNALQWKGNRRVGRQTSVLCWSCKPCLWYTSSREVPRCWTGLPPVSGSSPGPGARSELTGCSSGTTLPSLGHCPCLQRLWKGRKMGRRSFQQISTKITLTHALLFGFLALPIQVVKQCQGKEKIVSQSSWGKTVLCPQRWKWEETCFYSMCKGSETRPSQHWPPQPLTMSQ